MLLFFWRPSQSVDFAAVLFESTVVFYTNSPKHRMCSELVHIFFSRSLSSNSVSYTTQTGVTQGGGLRYIHGIRGSIVVTCHHLD